MSYEPKKGFLTGSKLLLTFLLQSSRWFMVKRFSAATALSVVVTFLLVSIAHACSGLAPVGVMIEQSSRNAGMANNSPCDRHKDDVCKSVRDSILSIQPSVSKAEVSQPVLPMQLSIESESPTQVGFSPLFPVIERALHPVFKLPLIFSYLVLRI